VAPKTAGQGRSKFRRQTESGYSRGAQTRQRIINVALEMFARVGYARASMRDIAAKARVNAPVLHYYFEGKRGLYLACVEHIHLRARQLLQDIVDRARQALARDTSPAELIEIVCLIYERSAEYLLRNPAMQVWSEFMKWDGRDEVPCQSRKVLEQRTRRELVQLMWELIGRITGKGSQSVDTRIRALTLGGQLAVFDLAPQRSMDDLGWTEVDEQGLQEFKSILRQQTLAALEQAGQLQST
jgi:TetR/AcrR family transcriptional regulator, regulator of cefoperazone and chloramphenicol sensitivity